jgi:hypothetical protein
VEKEVERVVGTYNHSQTRCAKSAGHNSDDIVWDAFVRGVKLAR